MKRLGDMELPKKRIGFATAPREEEQQGEGGVNLCRAFQCPCYGTINTGGKDWFCRFHVNRPSWAAKVVTQSLTRHRALVAEIEKGSARIAANREYSDAMYQTKAIEQSERLIASGYDIDLDQIEAAQGKCWNIAYKQFIFGLDKMLSKYVNHAVKDHKE